MASRRVSPTKELTWLLAHCKVLCSKCACTNRNLMQLRTRKKSTKTDCDHNTHKGRVKQIFYRLLNRKIEKMIHTSSADWSPHPMHVNPCAWRPPTTLRRSCLVCWVTIMRSCTIVLVSLNVTIATFEPSGIVFCMQKSNEFFKASIWSCKNAIAFQYSFQSKNLSVNHNIF